MKQAIRIAAAGLPRSCAAPAGGALTGGRGRLKRTVFAGALSVSLSVCGPVASETLTVPSGRAALPIEYLSDVDGQGPVLRARYHMAALTGADDAEDNFADMTHLCETDARVLRDTLQPAPARIIVSLSSEPLEFGVIDANVVQYFEAFRVDGSRCIWELY